ncbi:hypothetical protein CCZ20_27875 [Priestia aryabhattai]|uniref:hypothetical protein n=1 Tax=Priestia aryabhattai TaxID=412384 RepID=UPI000B511CD3|nr:hypothetical protein [Priestia aryabhattai]OVE34186.1 hypothetical protein CCZ20_27875 [Priestia aryabhattai]
MKDVIFVLCILSVGLVFGTFLRLLSYGLSKKLTVILAMATPLLVTCVHLKQIINFLLKGQFIKFVEANVFILKRYPILVTAVGEIATESMASRIASENVKRKRKKELLLQEVVKPREVGVVNKLTKEVNAVETIFSIFGEFLTDKKNRDFKYS